MNEQIYTDDNIAVIRRNGSYFVRYDAGAHQIAMREDEISEEEANDIARSPVDANRVLFAVQRRLEQAGLDPYVSNLT